MNILDFILKIVFSNIIMKVALSGSNVSVRACVCACVCVCFESLASQTQNAT
jgi:hypothetical protein